MACLFGILKNLMKNDDREILKWWYGIVLILFYYL